MKVVFCIGDLKAAAYMEPFVLPTRGVAVREFTRMANSPEHNIGMYPDDYVLYEIGTYDEQTGELVPYEVRQVVGSGRDFVEVKV